MDRDRRSGLGRLEQFCDAEVGEQRPRVSGELGVDQDQLGRDGAKGIHEPDDVEPPAFIRMRPGVERRGRFYHRHQLGALFRPRRAIPLASATYHPNTIGRRPQLLEFDDHALSGAPSRRYSSTSRTIAMSDPAIGIASSAPRIPASCAPIRTAQSTASGES